MKRISLWTVWKLRFKLWRMFNGAGSTKHHRLKVRWNGRSKMWVWVCELNARNDTVPTVPQMQRWQYALGPLQQWTLPEALSLAARKAEWVLHPEQEPVKEPDPPQTVPKHNRAYRMLEDGQFRVECVCGWIGGTRCHPETTAPGWCHKCGVAEESYDRHEQASQKQEAVAQ